MNVNLKGGDISPRQEIPRGKIIKPADQRNRVFLATGGVFFSFRERADGAIYARFLCGPTFLGQLETKADDPLYSAKALCKTEGFYIERQSLSSAADLPDMQRLFEQAARNDLNSLKQTVEILRQKSVRDRVLGTLDLIIADRSYPSPPTTQAEIAAASGASRNRAIRGLEIVSSWVGTRRKTYSLNEQSKESRDSQPSVSAIPTSINKEFFSSEEDLTLAIEGLQTPQRRDRIVMLLFLLTNRGEAPSPSLTQTQLAKLTRGSRATVNEIITRLEEENCVQREGGRGAKYSLTREGTSLAEQIREGLA